MYLETWMIATLCLAFGVCAHVSSKRGFASGAIRTLQALEEQRYIKIDVDGSIKRWTPYNDLPVKKKSSKKKIDTLE